MSLYKRLADAHGTPEPQRGRSGFSMAELRQRIHESMVGEIGELMRNEDISEEQLHNRIREEVQSALARERVPLSSADRAKLVEDLTADILGYGPLDELLAEGSVSDILVNGPHNVFVEQGGKLTQSDIEFFDEKQLRRIIDKICSQVGRRIDDVNPMVDARLPDGSRVNAVVHPVAHQGPYLTIRKFGEERMTIDDLIRFGTLTPQAARLLQACVVGRLNIVVSGGSSSGKTTTLNVLSAFLPPDERIITIEDAKELLLQQEHVLPMESRPPNVDGKGEVSVRDLVRNSLRMRPDRIVVGECRGGEALDMLQAMNTGHDGSLTTVHSNGPSDALTRLEVLVLMSGFDLPVRAIREQVSSAIDLVVHMARLRDGTRRITHITEVQGMEGDEITTSDVFLFDYSMGMDEHGKYRGKLKPTGVQPQFIEKLLDLGIKLPADTFTEDVLQTALPEANEARPGDAPAPPGETDDRPGAAPAPVGSGSAPVMVAPAGAPSSVESRLARLESALVQMQRERDSVKAELEQLRAAVSNGDRPHA